MAEDKENPLSRWSRLKRASARAGETPKPAAPAAEAPLPELPPLDQLSGDSDFSAFMDKRVDERLRRLALKKLFGDPRFNVTDGLDVYAEDYSKLADLPPEVVATLEHARRTLRRREPEREKEEEAQPQQQVAREIEAEEDLPEQDNENNGDESPDVARGQDT
jgi:hypothetical protein